MTEQDVVKTYLPFVKHIARKWYFPKYGHDWNDLVQAGSVGVLYALKRFDPSKSASFSTYAFFWIRKFVTMEVRKFAVVRRGETYGSDDTSVFDLIPDNAPGPLEKLLAKEITDLQSSGLTAREIEVLQLLYFDLLTMRQVAGITGLTFQRVAQIKDEAVRKLRKRFLTSSSRWYRCHRTVVPSSDEASVNAKCERT